MAYEKAVCIELIDINIVFRMLDELSTSEYIANHPDSDTRFSKWDILQFARDPDVMRLNLEAEKYPHVLGCDLVKIAKIFGADVNEEDVVRHVAYRTVDNVQKKEEVEFAGDIIIPIYRGHSIEVVVQHLGAQVNDNGTIDIETLYDRGDSLDRMSYNGVYFVEWLMKE